MQSRPAVSLSSRQRKPAGGAQQYLYVAVYLLGLYCWWMSCGFYFGVSSSTAAPVQPEADPSLECQRMRVAYEVTPGRGWGKLPTALQARWKELGCDAFIKETASAPAAATAAAATAPIATEVATPAVPAAAASATATSTAITTAAATATATTAAAAAAAATAAATAAGCPATRKPYHTLLTGQGTIYNGWQARIMYFHWKKQSKRDGPCTEMTGLALGGKSLLRPRLRLRLRLRPRLRLRLRLQSLRCFEVASCSAASASRRFCSASAAAS